MMKRTILLVLIISVAFMFSSCDPILEALFPKAAGGGGEGMNTIELDVWIDVYSITGGDYNYFYQHPVILWVERFNESTYIWEEVPGTYREVFGTEWFYERFDFLPGGEYQIFVYWDEDGNYSYDGYEPSTYAFDYNISSTTVYLENNPDMPSWVYMNADIY